MLFSSILPTVDVLSKHAAPPAPPAPPARTGAAAHVAAVALAVEVVALAELPEDLPAGHVARVAHALPADAVPQPRADDGHVVLAAVALQLLAAAALRLALAVLAGVAGVAPGREGRVRPPPGPRPWGRRAQPPRGGGGASPADAALHRALVEAQAAVPAHVAAVACALGKGLHGHRVREAQRPDDERRLRDALRGRDLHLEGDLRGTAGLRRGWDSAAARPPPGVCGGAGPSGVLGRAPSSGRRARTWDTLGFSGIWVLRWEKREGGAGPAVAGSQHHDPPPLAWA